MGKVLLVGWDAADWKIIHPLLDHGKMPHLAALIQNGVMGNLSSLRPELSPMLWTSIATGKRPHKHGVLGFVEPGPDGKGVRPVTNLSRKTKTIWNILNQNDYRSIVVGWWPSHPAEPIRGVMVSNHFQHAVAPYGFPWPMVPEAVFPERLRENLAALRVHPQELDPGLIGLFVPDLAGIDQEKDRRIEAIAKIAAETTTINRVATALMHHEKWDFAAVYFDGIDHFCHGFMDFYPPRLSRVCEEDFNHYKYVIESGYILHDTLLGSLLAETEENTTIILVSDHGFHSDHLRPLIIPGEPAGPAAQHRPYGVVVISGPGIKKDTLLHGSSLLDICPTILSCYDLPIGEDMDGKVLLQAFAHKKQILTIPSWDLVPGNDGSHPGDLTCDSLAEGEAVRQLADLGYIELPENDTEKAAVHAGRELLYNLARSYMDAEYYVDARGVLQGLYADWPEELRFGVELVYCYQALGMAAQAKKLLHDVLSVKEVQADKAKKELLKARAEIEAADDQKAKKQELKPLIGRLLQKSSRNRFGRLYLLGSACLATGEYGEALGCFEEAELEDIVSSSLYVQKGAACDGLRKKGQAEKAYRRALEIDPENSDAMLGLCRLYLHARKNREAAHMALDAIGLRYHFPLAHFCLGCALHRLGKLSDAVKALKTAVHQNPNFPDAHDRLAHIYRKRLGLHEQAAICTAAAEKGRRRIRQIKKDGAVCDASYGQEMYLPDMQSNQDRYSPAVCSGADFTDSIVVVSGLPRSGTSMVMQMLQAGGIPLLIDERRQANEDNPRGYFEYDRVRKLAGDNGWLLKHKGQAVKVVSQLLPFLPAVDTTHYKIIFIERSLDEILQSQTKMLVSLGKERKQYLRTLVKSGFYRQLETAKAFLAAVDLPVCYIRHRDCLCEPALVSGRISSFLGGCPDAAKMAGAVDTALYRNRID